MSEEEKVRVSLGDDYYGGPYFNTDLSLPMDYEIPKSQLERWEAAMAAYCTMQNEIEQVMEQQRERVLEARRARPESPLDNFLKRTYASRIKAAVEAPPLFRAKEPE